MPLGHARPSQFHQISKQHTILGLCYRSYITQLDVDLYPGALGYLPPMLLSIEELSPGHFICPDKALVLAFNPHELKQRLRLEKSQAGRKVKLQGQNRMLKSAQR